MAKNKITGISEALKQQAAERFNPVSENDSQEDIISGDIVSVESTEKIRKNFYIDKHLVKLLRKMAYEEESDQTKIINRALSEFFKNHGYSE